MDDFNKEKAKLINEVNRFEDSGNDLIFIAKEMARMMQDMVAFTKGKGPLKNNTDVINIATQISVKGEEAESGGGTREVCLVPILKCCLQRISLGS